MVGRCGCRASGAGQGARTRTPSVREGWHLMGRVTRRLGMGRLRAARHGGHTSSAGPEARVPRVAPGCRTVLAAAAALCTMAVLPGVAVADDDEGIPNPYAYAGGAQTVEGGGSVDAARQISPDATVQSSIGPGGGGSQGKRYYSMALDAADNVYVSVTAVPRLGTKVAYDDGIKVTLQDGEGSTCSTGDAQFDPAASPRPVSAVATRMIQPQSSGACQQAGTYYLLVERTTGADSSLDEWGLEIHGVSEPGLRTAEPESSTPPDAWASTSPTPPSGQPQERPGGSSFSTASGLTNGAWQDHISPGQTLFYRVPVGWGQQIFAQAELTGAEDGSDESHDSDGPGDDSVGSPLVMTLYNPVRSLVDTAHALYQGERATAALRPLPPAAYGNRNADDSRTAAMRLGGSYYLAITLDPGVAKFGSGAYRVSLAVTVRGHARQSPDYAGSPKPTDAFVVTPPDQRTAEPETASDAPAHNDGMKLLAAASLGTGTLLVLVLAVWTLLARRRVTAP